jgi:hypothetical protein
MGFLEFGPTYFMCCYSPERNLIGEVLERDKMEEMSQSPTLRFPVKNCFEVMRNSLIC